MHLLDGAGENMVLFFLFTYLTYFSFLIFYRVNFLLLLAKPGKKCLKSKVPKDKETASDFVFS